MALRECDEDKLDLEAIQKLKSCIASVSDSVENINTWISNNRQKVSNPVNGSSTNDKNGYKDIFKNMQGVEAFVVTVFMVPLYDKRINSLGFKYNFDSEFSLLSDNVAILKSAFKSIKSNDKFKKLIRMILEIGNFLNYRNPRSVSYGFKLKSLKDLGEIKSKKIDGDKYSLLDFIIINLRDNAPEILEFAKIFIPLAEAVKIDVAVLDTRFNELEKQIKSLESDLKVSSDYIQTQREALEGETDSSKLYDIQSSEYFVEKFSQFHFEANEMFLQLTQDYKEVKDDLRKEANLYGEDEETTIVEFIDHIYKFGRDFNGALKTMVLQERIRKQKQKRLQTTKGVKSVKIDLHKPKAPLKSSYKTLTQLNSTNDEKKRPRFDSFNKSGRKQFDKNTFSSSQKKSKSRLMMFSKKDYAESDNNAEEETKQAYASEQTPAASNGESPRFGGSSVTSERRSSNRVNLFGGRGSAKGPNLFANSTKQSKANSLIANFAKFPEPPLDDTEDPKPTSKSKFNNKKDEAFFEYE